MSGDEYRADGVKITNAAADPGLRAAGLGPVPPGGVAGAPPSETARILLVDDDPAQLHLLRGMLAPDGYAFACAEGGAAAMEAIAEHAPDLVLLDLHMPEPDGFAVLARLKSEAWTARIPVVVVTASEERAERVRALEIGAEDFIPKPVERDELRARVRWLVRAKQRADESEQAENVLLALGRAVAARDPGLREHCERLAHLVLAIGQDLGLEPADLRTLRRGAYLHDIGKVALPDSALLKPGQLNAAEAAALRTHPVVGEQILRPLRTFDAVRPLVRHHHEHLDGSGYPDGLRGEQIDRLVRILSVADVFDTRRSVRPYRPALTAADALAALRAEAEGGWWDPVVVGSLGRAVAHDAGR